MKGFIFSRMKYQNRLLVAVLLLSFKQVNSQVVRDTVISLYFPTGAYELDSLHTKQLAWLASSDHSVKQITGYADHRGSTSSNQRLSQKRAEAVARLLASGKKGLTVMPESKGETGTQLAELWKNRRVDIVAAMSASTPSTAATIRSLELDNIYFVPDSAVITPKSLPFIKELAQTLKNYQDEHFEIIGHANCQETLEPSKIKIFYRLSEQRAKLIYQLLLQHGIPAEKMSYKGIANTQPAIETPQNVAEKKMNMRVQILITKGS
ncbi:hypothetical protein SY85_15255 [Flavisolibacter tropicus]|uniref:OmpA-like domain-containing protein n=2 Tax=Flavisolibacter tropicus TaxID=1492898 RepID=A0A172TY40_9BACT|nr:hypothetical protein SY85_15255 [Flavisolibacter tropicus]